MDEISQEHLPEWVSQIKFAFWQPCRGDIMKRIRTRLFYQLDWRFDALSGQRVIAVLLPELLNAFASGQKKAGKVEETKQTYAMALRLLVNVFGEVRIDCVVFCTFFHFLFVCVSNACQLSAFCPYINRCTLMWRKC